MPKAKPVRAVPRRKTPRTPMRPTAKAIVVAPLSPKPWELSAEEVAILKNAVAKGATDEELKYCLSVARRYKLDPFQKQIWFVPRWDSQAEQSEGTRGGRVWVPIVGIDGLRHIAARDHADYGTFSEPTYGPMQEINYQKNGKGPTLKMKAPESARIESWKKGAAHPTVGQVWWSEIYPDIDYAPLVRRMPRLMLAKCAMAQAIRANYPSTGGLLIPEETHNHEFTAFSPEGRLLTTGRTDDTKEDNPYLSKYLEREKQALDKLTPEQREVLEAKMSKKGSDASRPAPFPRAPYVTDTIPQERSGGGDAHAAQQHAVPCLFYTYFPASETYRIDGAQELKEANRDLLAPLWNQVARAIVATPSDLGRLISQFEDRKVPFKELKYASTAGC